VSRFSCWRQQQLGWRWLVWYNRLALHLLLLSIFSWSIPFGLSIKCRSPRRTLTGTQPRSEKPKSGDELLAQLHEIMRPRLGEPLPGATPELPEELEEVQRRTIEKVANRNVRGFGWEDRSRGRYATPADSPLRVLCTSYRSYAYDVGVWGLGFVHRSRAIFCRPAPEP
jgi:hypothetical protein